LLWKKAVHRDSTYRVRGGVPPLKYADGVDHNIRTRVAQSRGDRLMVIRGHPAQDPLGRVYECKPPRRLVGTHRGPNLMSVGEHLTELVAEHPVSAKDEDNTHGEVWTPPSARAPRIVGCRRVIGRELTRNTCRLELHVERVFELDGTSRR
jgi:hypothetical protein